MKAFCISNLANTHIALEHCHRISSIIFLGLVHTYPERFINAKIIYPFSKKFCVHTRLFPILMASNNYFWTNDEVELLFKVANEYVQSVWNDCKHELGVVLVLVST